METVRNMVTEKKAWSDWTMDEKIDCIAVTLNKMLDQMDLCKAAVADLHKNHMTLNKKLNELLAKKEVEDA